MSICYYIGPAGDLAFRAVASNYVAASGEAVYSVPQSIARLASFSSDFSNALSSVSNYASGIALYEALVINGLYVSSSGTPSFSGTFMLDGSTQAKFQNIATVISTTGFFPGSPSGATSFTYSGVTFPTITLYKNFYAAYSNFLQAAQTAEATVQNGGSWSPPATSVVIP